MEEAQYWLTHQKGREGKVQMILQEHLRTSNSTKVENAREHGTYDEFSYVI